MYGGGGGKLSTLVDFPLEGLDISPYVLSQKKSDPLIYDCFAVSNHYGSCGFGHYTAYAKNWKENIWYSFDDSNCSKTSVGRVVSDGAYNLFYRRRDHINLESINYEQLKQVPTTE
mmetsp:Transcript_18217/g.17341  ORF Transcript_18217/g.17341 Transcript_18217/m.17341 type:complete len:116 (-) Transcript_18217:45-392(-)